MLCAWLYRLFVSKLFGKLFGRHAWDMYIVYICRTRKKNRDKILCFMHCRIWMPHKNIFIAEIERTFSFILLHFYCSFGLHISSFFFLWKYKLNKGEADFPINETHAHGLPFVFSKYRRVCMQTAHEKSENFYLRQIIINGWNMVYG